MEGYFLQCHDCEKGAFVIFSTSWSKDLHNDNPRDNYNHTSSSYIRFLLKVTIYSQNQVKDCFQNNNRDRPILKAIKIKI